MKMSKIETPMRVVMAFHQAFNRHDIDGMMNLLCDDCLLENNAPSPDGAVYSGKAAIAQYWESFFRGSPRAHMEIEQIHGFGFRCVMLWKCDWEDAAGIKAHVRGMDLFDIKNGCIGEELSYRKG